MKYLIIKTKKSEEIILLCEKSLLDEVKQQYPDKAIYFPQEIDTLYNLKEDASSVNIIHTVKKMFEGWIIPKKCDISQNGGTNVASQKAGQKV